MASPSRLEIVKGSNASPMLLVIFSACRFLILKPAVLPGSTIKTLSPVYRYRRHRTAHTASAWNRATAFQVALRRVPSVLAWNLVSHPLVDTFRGSPDPVHGLRAVESSRQRVDRNIEGWLRYVRWSSPHVGLPIRTRNARKNFPRRNDLRGRRGRRPFGGGSDSKCR
jgi:hypothetical protein